MTTLPNVIEELLHNNIEVTLKRVNTELRYYLPGFYKSNGFVYLVEEDDKIYCHQRWDRKDEVYDLMGILFINKHWWEVTKERNPNTVIPPDSEWLDLLLKYDVVKKETKTIVEFH